ncbi:Aminoacylase-1 [Smittium culicis]|uniref:Aminoacylase-1 n=1 Tax=Smittium culicis TaxID=133412 RepID=A0A1R1Y6F1_9FUNG|nr:Aminoacylase-1 [Smittium culicis]
MEPASVTRFREYLKIETVHPTPDYQKCTEFLVQQAEEIGLECKVVELVKGKPVVIMKLEGTDPSLPGILLNSHTDVVPVYREKWNYEPFEATRVEIESGDHRIYARGSQDMKVTGSLYLEAFREIKESGKKFLRNVYSTFVPDEEIYSIEGMMPFSKSQEFKDMNIGFGIDEEGGKQPNVVPATYSATFDLRITPLVNLDEFYKYLEDLAATNDCEIEFYYRDESDKSAKITDSNSFLIALKSTCSKMGLNPIEIIFPAATDARFVRQAGIQAIGINPMLNHPVLAHDHDEYVVESEFIKAIPFYTDLIEGLASISE